MIKYTKEQTTEINNINYMFLCNKYQILKPNSEYTKKNYGRQIRKYNSRCKTRI